MRTIKTVDVHVGGQPVRVVIEGVPGADGVRTRVRRRSGSPRTPTICAARSFTRRAATRT